jgi:hypothetical protein
MEMGIEARKGFLLIKEREREKQKGFNTCISLFSLASVIYIGGL